MKNINSEIHTFIVYFEKKKKTKLWLQRSCQLVYSHI